MTYAPATLSALARYWIEQDGVMLGIVGNRAHTKGYHCGKDRIYDGSGPGIGDADYSVQHPRDKAGLSNAASAIDLGRLGGTLEGLQAFSRWLVAECQANRVWSRDIREVIYSPDGTKVQRYSGIDGDIHTGPGNGDDSHEAHTHISFFRDSVARDKVPLFAPYFVTPPDTSTGEAMPTAVNAGSRLIASDYVREVKAGIRLYRDTAGTVLTKLSQDAVLDDFGLPVGSGDWVLLRVGSAHFDADPEMEQGLGLARMGDVGPLRRKTPAELAAAANRFASIDAAYNEGRDAVVNAAASVPRR